MVRPEVERARKLRREMSLPEVLLWQRLRGRPDGIKMRRQHPVGRYVVDFYCREAALAIEVDGIAHDAEERAVRDDARTCYIESTGLTVLRIPAADVLRDPDIVAASIVALAATPLHQPPAGPPPRAGEDQE